MHKICHCAPVTVETIAYPKNELHDLKSLEKKRAAAVEKKIGFESKAKEAENEINKLDFATQCGILKKRRHDGEKKIFLQIL